MLADLLWLQDPGVEKKLKGDLWHTHKFESS